MKKILHDLPKINKNLIFIDSMQFMNSSLDALVKNLSDDDFKHLLQEFSGELLELVKEKGGSLWSYYVTYTFKRISLKFRELYSVDSL